MISIKDIQNYLFSYFTMPFNNEITLEDVVKQIEEENVKETSE